MPLKLTTRPFLLTEGGPLFLIVNRLIAAENDAPALARRAILSILITWLPLLALSTLRGDAFGGAVSVPFLRDFSAYARFLLTIPVLLAAETILAPRIAVAAGHFVASGLVLQRQYPQFNAAIERGLKLRDSVVAEVVMAILAYAITIVFFSANAVHVGTWYADRSAGGFRLTPAGWWFLGFCIPLFHFLILRWLWRLFLWYRFLAKMSRLDLQLFPTHPDQAAGLGFVGNLQLFFGVLLAAYSATVAGVWANAILYDHLALEHFALPAVVYVLLSVALILSPLAVFANRLFVTKTRGLYQYGALATLYGGSFDRKWISNTDQQQEALLGSADIQSLADLGNSYGFIENMNILPVTPKTPLVLVLASSIPLSPLILTVIPLKQVLQLLFKAFT